MKDVFLSVVVPAYNEEDRIIPTIIDIHNYLRRRPWEWEIIVVDDGSRDDTTMSVERCQNAFPNIKLISYPNNQGKGYAVREGMRWAHGAYRLFLDADHSVSIEHWDTFLTFLQQGFDVVIGSIEEEGAEVEEQGFFWRRTMGRLGKMCVRRFVLPDIRDSMRGFKAFTAKAAQDIFERQTVNGWMFDAEILFIAHQRGCRIKEVPVKFVNAANSKFTLLSYLDVLYGLFLIKKNLANGLYR